MYKYLTIKEKLLSDLTKMSPHTRLASRNAMCIKYAATRTTVDRAINELIEEGFVYSRVGSGTYVSDQNAGVKRISYWGVILPEMGSLVYPSMLEGIQEFVHRKNVNIVICNSDHDTCREFDHISRLIKSGIEGFIIVPCITSEMDYRVYRLMENNHIPFVFCNRLVDGIRAPFISSNSYYGGYLATEYLINRGAKKIAYISKKRYKSSIERYSGYSMALRASGFQLSDEAVLLNYNEQQEIRHLIMNYHPDAVFAFNDFVASEVYHVFTELHMQIGVDISLIGYDNSTVCELMPQKLTSVSYKASEIGYKAAEVLFDMIESGNYPKMDVIIFQPEIVERNSCR